MQQLDLMIKGYQDENKKAEIRIKDMTERLREAELKAKNESSRATELEMKLMLGKDRVFIEEGKSEVDIKTANIMG